MNKNTVHDCPDPAELARSVAQDVQKYGWHITYLSASDESPGWAYTTGWAYTIGLFETFHHPEVSVFGLGDDILIGIVNSLAKDVQTGQQYVAGNSYSRVLQGFDCIFHSVDALWLPYFFGNATRFYRDREFRMLQCFWPDKQQRFPWNQQFPKDWSHAQPWLFRRYLTDARTKHFLTSSDSEDLLIKLQEVEEGLSSVADTMTSACTQHKTSAEPWPFANPKTFHGYALGDAAVANEPITGASHEDSNTWLFFSDKADPDSEAIRELCVACLLESNPSISEIADLPIGWMAKKTKAGWLRRETASDQE